MSAFRRYAVTAALAGLTSLAACGTTPATQPGAARSPGPAAATQAPPAATPAPGTATPAPSGTPKVPPQPVLRLDSRGRAVLALQQRLAALRYFDVAKADGVFGPGTYHAVVAFQKVQGLTRDGIAGPATGARLARPDIPAARYRLAATSLEVNLARQVIYYVSAGTIQRIIDASTGSGAWYYSHGRQARAITPAGRYRIYWRYPGGRQPGPLSSMYRPVYFHSGYAVHGMTSVPAYPASQDAHVPSACMPVRVSPSVIGRYARSRFTGCQPGSA